MLVVGEAQRSAATADDDVDVGQARNLSATKLLHDRDDPTVSVSRTPPGRASHVQARAEATRIVNGISKRVGLEGWRRNRPGAVSALWRDRGQIAGTRSAPTNRRQTANFL
jgi:hypothetical protein